MCILQDKEKEEEPTCIIQLTEDEAKEVAFLLAGTMYQTAPADKLEFLTREVVMEWLKVQENSKLSGRTIADNQIRRKTGVSVIAIIRNNRIIPSPDPTQKIEAGDTIVVVGTREQIKNFIELFGGLKPE
jgi:TrkA domain protein